MSSQIRTESRQISILWGNGSRQVCIRNHQDLYPGKINVRRWKWDKRSTKVAHSLNEDNLPSFDGNVSPILVRRASKCPTTIRARLAPASVTKLSWNGDAHVYWLVYYTVQATTVLLCSPGWQSSLERLSRDKIRKSINQGAFHERFYY